MNKPTVVLITSASCGPCVQFKRHVLPGLKEKIKKGKLVNLEHLESQGLDFNFKVIEPSNVKTFNPQIRNFANVFPSMFIFDTKSWKNPSVDLKGEEIQFEAFSVDKIYNQIEKKAKKYEVTKTKTKYSKTSEYDITPTSVSIKPWPIVMNSVKDIESSSGKNKPRIEVFDSRNLVNEKRNPEKVKSRTKKSPDSLYKFKLARI